jgi:hypothetical protein
MDTPPTMSLNGKGLSCAAPSREGCRLAEGGRAPMNLAAGIIGGADAEGKALVRPVAITKT